MSLMTTVCAEQIRAALELPDDENKRAIAPYLGRTWSVMSPEWHSLVAQESARRQIAFRYWLNRIFDWAIPSQSRKRSVERNYDQIWAEADFAKIVDPAKNQMPHEWRDEGFMLNSSVTQKLQLNLLTKAIRFLRPQSVLEVGSGWGLNLMVLACLCPETRFQGVELTKSGVEMTKAMAAGKELPEPLVRFMPEAPVDPMGFQRIAVDRGSAERLPYADSSFDLVFTRLALEQMESIRETALSEVARVARSHVVMIESFREMNDKGLRRQYAIANNYFRGRLADLPRYGLEPVFTYAEWPHKITLKPVFVLAKKTNAGARDK
jgi:SAM-dependent methyltransferase